MYSYEDRIRAVHLYITRQTSLNYCRQSVLSDNQSSERWNVEQYEQCHDLPAGYVHLRPKYSAEQRSRPWITI